jgi:hypothetical protein
MRSMTDEGRRWPLMVARFYRIKAIASFALLRLYADNCTDSHFYAWRAER